MPEPLAAPPTIASMLAGADAEIAKRVAAGELPKSETGGMPQLAEKEAWEPGQEEPAAPAADPKAAKPAEKKPEPPPKEEPKPVTPDERAQFRAEKRTWREKAERELAARVAEVEKARGETAKWQQAAKLHADGDIEAAMQAAFGLGISELNKQLVAKHSGKDPRLDRMAAELAEEKKARQERERIDAEQQGRIAQQRADAEWKQGLSKQLDADDAAKPFAKNPHVLHQILLIQRQHWDGSETITAREAFDELIGSLDDDDSRGIYELLHHVHGGRAAQPEASPGGGARRTKTVEAAENGSAPRTGAASAKPKTVSHTRAAEVAPADPDGFDPKRWKERWTKRMNGASDG